MRKCYTLVEILNKTAYNNAYYSNLGLFGVFKLKNTRGFFYHTHA